MFLKRLSIYGFKSFAERIEIEFSDGITALLGPNGCGKSNVVDAVKWVLGEHAVKSLRAERMEDVIFDGTESRKPLNVAEVTLGIVNETGLLPMDMPEVEIKRRLYRSGESEYFINGAHVRLKDIRELFWDTGVGKAAYSVMEQGKIDQILSSKPDERRYLFEEAAGITRYRERGAEAERNLARTEENVRQLTLILNEVRRSHDSLKIQSEKTLKYRTLRDEIFNYELDIQLLRLKQFRYEKGERTETLKRRTADRDRIRAEMEAENKALEANMDEVNSMEARLVELQKNLYGLALEKNARENEIRLYNEQRGESSIKIGQNESREKQAQHKIAELIEDAAAQDAIVGDMGKQTEGIEENIKSFEENIQLAAVRIGDNEAAAQRAEEEILNFEKRQAAFEKDLALITDDIVAELDAGLKKAGYSASERRNAETALYETLGRLRTILSGREALIRDLAAAAGAVGIDAAELGRIANSLAAELAEAAASADRAMALFKNYREHSPTFIDEFLSPQGIITKKRALDAQIKSAKDGIDERRQRIKTLNGDNISLLAKIDEYRVTLENLRVSRVQMKARAQSAEEQARLIRREMSGQEGLLKSIRDELFFDRKRLEEIDERIAATQEETSKIGKKTTALSEDLEKLEKDIRKRNDNVAGKKVIINKRMAELSKVQEALEKIHLELAQTETEIRNIQDNFRETHSRDLIEFEERVFTITAAPADLREKLSTARVRIKELGSVNLMAPEEFAETKERYDFLASQMADLEKARKDLEDLTVEISQESSQLFLSTYNRIKKNFHNMFRRLFGGGRAELRLLDPNHILESGIEIYAQPPGKKLEHLSLLSGGECSMTAVALLFATYMVKPSPFCLLDEIDAALDEQNVGRFAQLLREFSDTSQFIIITHNKKTVTEAKTLIGVTMEESGITKLITVRLKNEELAIEDSEPPQHELWDKDNTFKEEDVPPEEGMELPIGVNDPKKVTQAQLRPIRSGIPKKALTERKIPQKEQKERRGYILSKQDAIREVKENILPFWQGMIDEENGGFFGEADFYGKPDKNAAKGCILNSRILWTFSAAYRVLGDDAYMVCAKRARDFLEAAFVDKEHGGLYWLANQAGKAQDTRKQFYNIAFGVYALSEHYQATGDQSSLELALVLFDAIERYGYDPVTGGYIEARSREWDSIDDFRLSGKDLNCPKSMNTNLHVLEAYTNLARVSADERVRKALENLLQTTLEKIVNRNWHFELFFDMEWHSLCGDVSYGHDIEGSWLLYEAALAVGGESLVSAVRQTALAIAETAYAAALDRANGGLFSGCNAAGHTHAKKEWWPQAEAVAGFYNAFELSGDQKYFDAAAGVWNYIQSYFIDRVHGEWHNELNPDNTPDVNMPKAGFWKCPYHNARACFEIIKRGSPERGFSS